MKYTVFKCFVTGIIVLHMLQAQAQDSLYLALDKPLYARGDTIRLQYHIPAWEGTARLATLQVLADAPGDGRQWRFRYPLMDGFFESSWILPEDLPDGVLKITAFVQPVFFQLTGQLKNRVQEDSLRYTFQLEDTSLISGTVALNSAGAFRLPRHVFSGKAVLFFAPMRAKGKLPKLDISITTPLDSVYQPIASAYATAVVGRPAPALVAMPHQADTISLMNGYNSALKNVTVTAQSRTPLELLDDRQSSGTFKSERQFLFGGTDEIFAGSINVLEFLISRVPGLNIVRDTETLGGYWVSWRNEPTAFFIDEMPVDMQAMVSYPLSEVALVKVFPPPFTGMPFGGGGGAVAIYSKNPGTAQPTRYKNRFVIQGYAPALKSL